MKRIIGISFILILFVSGCRLTYLFHAAAGQFRLLRGSIPVEDALEKDALGPKQKERLRLVARIKDFGEDELGLKKTKNYQKIYLKSRQNPVYTISASPKDRLARITWWFPVVGNMPYLGFFDLESAKKEKQNLVKKDLDVTIGMADAYSTLGWFRDPVTMNLIEGSTVGLVETILHEMTHTTLYVKGEGEFNEGLAVVVAKTGTLLFTQRNYGSSHPLTLEAKKTVEDQRVFSSFLASLLQKLEYLYSSPIGYQGKLAQRERVFASSLEEFGQLKSRLHTQRFIHFGHGGLNNAYLLSIGLYHRNFHLFEAVLNNRGNSIREMLDFFSDLAEGNGNLLERTRRWLHRQTASVDEH